MNAASVRRAIGITLVLLVISLGALGYAFYAMQRASVNHEQTEENRIQAQRLISET